MKRKPIVLAATVLAAALLVAPSGAWALGVGAEVGAVKAETGSTGTERGLFARLGLLGPLDLQVDYAVIDYGSDRSDSRFGVGLRIEPLHLGHWIPAAFANTGIVDVDAPAWQGKLGIFELGLGMVYALNDNIRLELNGRQGHQDVLVDDGGRRADMSTVLASGGESYWSAALGLSLAF
jgi:hypothetical protein